MAAGPRTALHFVDFRMRTVCSLVEPWLGSVGVAVRLLARPTMVKAVVVPAVKTPEGLVPGVAAPRPKWRRMLLRWNFGRKS